MDKKTELKNKFLEYRNQKKKATKIGNKVIIDFTKVDKIADILCPSNDEISEELSLMRR